MIRGDLVDLRPLTAADVERAESVANDPDYNGPFGSFALAGAGEVRRRFELDGYLSHDHGRLTVADKRGRAVGGVSYIVVFHGPPPSNRVYNIGIDIDPAQALLARYLFATYTVERVEASTDVENLAEQRALEKAGFMLDGALRGAQFRAGAYHDLFVYSRLRDDPE